MDNNKGKRTQYRNNISLVHQDDRVILEFPFKDCVLEAGMTKEDKKNKRCERFLNTEIEIDKQDIDVLQQPKVFTKFSEVSIKGEKEVNDSADNIFFDDSGNLKNHLLIKGNNLISLYSLQQKFAGKIKMIYIDPPYNTGGDANIFTYNNTYNHSSWLVFMKNRLEVAKQLLRDDGFIAIAIDHYELFYLGVLADEIFGRENRVGIISVLHNPEGRQHATYFTATNEFFLLYRKSDVARFFSTVLQENIRESKDIEDIYPESDDKGRWKEKSFIRLGGGDSSLRENKPNGWYPIFVNPESLNVYFVKKEGCVPIYPITKAGQDRSWKLVKDSAVEKIFSGDIYAKKTHNRIEIFEKYREGTLPFITTIWRNTKYNSKTHGTKLLQKVLGYTPDFSYPKSVYLVQDILKLTTKDNDIVLDFFAGSGTTGHATISLNTEDGGNRKFILCEQIDEHFDICKERITKVLQQSQDLFQQSVDDKVICFDLKTYNQLYMNQINITTNKADLKKVYSNMQKNAFLQFWFDKKQFENGEYDSLSLEEQKEKLRGILDINQLYLNYHDIDDVTHNVSEIDKTFTNQFYGNGAS